MHCSKWLPYYIVSVYIFISMNNDTYMHIKNSSDKQKEFRIIFHTIEESLLIIEDRTINFANNHFLRHFKKVIKRIPRGSTDFRKDEEEPISIMDLKILREFDTSHMSFFGSDKCHLENETNA